MLNSKEHYDLMAKFDRDFTPRSGHKEPAAQKNRVKGQDVDAGVRVVIGTFSLTGDLAAKENIRAKETGARNQRKGNG